jgi:hypothetical protein
MSTTEKTYEMMWDCEYCGQKKLLGKTHRHCPSCGAPQNPEKRYFPPENEKVAVEDHQFVGADVHCPSCSFANSRAAKHCGNCGGPLAGGRDARMQQEQVVPQGGAPMPAGAFGQPAPGAPAPPAKSGTGKWLAVVVGVLLLGVITALIVGTCIKRDAAFEVAGHTWTRAIAIERYDEVREKSSCSSMPSDATRVTRTKAEPVCKTRKVDQGDGTFKEKKECTSPEEQCEYTVTKWKEARTEKATGNSVDDQLRWPEVRLRQQGNCIGCEREGARTETYTVKFVDTKSKEDDACNFKDQRKWASFKAGSRWAGKVAMIGGLDCDSLKPAK